MTRCAGLVSPVMGMLLAVVAAGPAAAGVLDGRVLVMPFEAKGRDARLYWLAEAAAVLLGDALAAKGVDTISREERLTAFEHLQLPARAVLSRATVIRIGELVGASHVVVGSVALDGDRLAVMARAIHLDVAALDAEVVEQGMLADLFVTFDRLAGGLTGLSRTAPAGAGAGSVPLAAFELYIKGLLAESPAAQAGFLGAALKISPSYDAARLALWQVYDAIGQPANALSAVTPVSTDSPAFRRARFLAALSLIHLHRLDEAYVALSGLAKAAPAAEIANNLGVVLLRKGSGLSDRPASSFFSEAVALDPDDPDYAFNLGYACWRERNAAEAIRWLREAVRRQTADAEAHFVLGVILKTTGADAEGEREIDLARRLSSAFDASVRPITLPGVPLNLERLRVDLDRPRFLLVAAAAGRADEADQQDLAAFHLARGRRLFELGQDREAEAELRRSVYLSPYQASAHLLLGRLALRQRRIREAIDTLKVAVWCEESADAHVALAEAYLEGHEPALARSEALRALQLDPQSQGARRLLDRLPPGVLLPPAV